MSPLISVIVPIYNIKEYLGKCIDSIIEQEFEDAEIILVDDGSTDGCAEICDQYARKDNRIKVVHKPNGGLVSARKAGAVAASGEYIATVDGDDGVTSIFFKTLIDIIERYSPELVLFDSVIIRGEKTVPWHSCLKDGYYDRNGIEKELLPCLIEDKMSRYIPPSQNYMIILREIYMECEMPIDEIMEIGEDGACTKPAIYRANSIYISHECLSIYNINENSMTKGKKVYDMMWPYYAAKQYEKMINIDDADIRDQIYRFITHNLFIACITQFYKKSPYKSIKQEISSCLANEYYSNAVKNCKFSFKNPRGSLARFCLKNRLYFIMRLYCIFLYKQ